MVNNVFYMQSHFTESEKGVGWWKDMCEGLIRKNREKYERGTWAVIRENLTDVDKGKFKYQAGGKLLTLECGRLLKSRFGGFAESLER